MLIIADASSVANSFRSLSGSISGPIALPTIILVKESWTSRLLTRRPGGLAGKLA